LQEVQQGGEGNAHVFFLSTGGGMTLWRLPGWG